MAGTLLALKYVKLQVGFWSFLCVSHFGLGITWACFFPGGSEKYQRTSHVTQAHVKYLQYCIHQHFGLITASNPQRSLLHSSLNVTHSAKAKMESKRIVNKTTIYHRCWGINMNNIWYIVKELFPVSGSRDIEYNYFPLTTYQCLLIVVDSTILKLTQHGNYFM